MSQWAEQIGALSYTARQHGPKAIDLRVRGVARFHPAADGSLPQVCVLPSFSKYQAKRARDLRILAAEIAAACNREKFQGSDRRFLLPAKRSPDWDQCLPGHGDQ